MLPKDTSDEILKIEIEKLKARQAELSASYKRRHGKQGVECTSLWEEYKRLYNNVHSQESRLRKRNLEKHQEKQFRERYHPDEDEYGIRPVDERKYIKCFKSGYIGEPVTRVYVRRMTGLSLKQIAILQERTGYVPVPAVGMAEAEADEKRRWETGDIY